MMPRPRSLRFGGSSRSPGWRNRWRPPAQPYPVHLLAFSTTLAVPLVNVFRPLAINIGVRYARSRRSFISFVTALALGGLALSVAILVFVQAVVAGFEREMNERILGVVPHVRLASLEPMGDIPGLLDAIRAVEGVSGAAQVVQGRGLLVEAGQVVGVNLIGFDPATYSEVSRIDDGSVERRPDHAQSHLGSPCWAQGGNCSCPREQDTIRMFL